MERLKEQLFGMNWCPHCSTPVDAYSHFCSSCQERFSESGDLPDEVIKRILQLVQELLLRNGGMKE